MLAGLTRKAKLRARTFRRCSVLRSDFLNGPEIVFTVPAGRYEVWLSQGKKYSYLLHLARCLTRNEVIGLDWYKSEESTHSEASDLSVGAPSLPSLVWQL
jgi:hypothetical protein